MYQKEKSDDLGATLFVVLMTGVVAFDLWALVAFVRWACG